MFAQPVQLFRTSPITASVAPAQPADASPSRRLTHAEQAALGWFRLSPEEAYAEAFRAEQGRERWLACASRALHEEAVRLIIAGLPLPLRANPA